MKKLTQKQYDEQVNRILLGMREKAVAFDDNSDIAKEQRIEKSRADIKYFAETYFPHYCTKPCGEFHDDLISYLDMPGEMGFFAGPRESGKTTWDALFAIVWFVVFELKHFMVIVSEDETIAEDYNNFVKLEFEYNERLRMDFGDLVGNIKWSTKDLVTKNNIRIWCRGWRQPIKGRRWQQYRPDYIVCIDVESLVTSRNPETVKQMKSKLAGEFFGSMAEEGTMLMEGQIVRKNCVLAQFVNEKDENSRPRYRSSVWAALLDNDTRSYWPEGWSVEKLQKKKYQMGTIEWNRWMQNRPADEEGGFREEWIRYYHPDELKNRQLTIVSYLDPSMTHTRKSDYKAIITMARDEEAIYYVLDAWIRRATVTQMVAATYTRYEEHNFRTFGAEDNALKDFLWEPFDNYAKIKGYNIPISPINNTMNKDDRVMQLSPDVERGKLRFCKGQSDQDLLVEQLIFWGQPGVKRDGPDGLHGAWSMFKKIGPVVTVINADVEDPYVRM